MTSQREAPFINIYYLIIEGWFNTSNDFLARGAHSTSRQHQFVFLIPNSRTDILFFELVNTVIKLSITYHSVKFSGAFALQNFLNNEVLKISFRSAILGLFDEITVICDLHCLNRHTWAFKVHEHSVVSFISMLHRVSRMHLGLPSVLPTPQIDLAIFIVPNAPRDKVEIRKFFFW